MADLSALRDLYAWMRAENVLYAKLGEIELRLGPPILPAVSASADDSPVDEREVERRDLETLLHSSGGDLSRILRLQENMRRQ